MKRRSIYPIFLSRHGCPGRCVYCRQEIHSDGDRSWSPEQVQQTLATWLPTRGDGEVAYYGGSFSLLPSSLQRAYLDVAGAFVASGRVRGIRISTHPAGLGDAQLEILRGRPLSCVEVGCQSFSDRVLEQAGRGHDAADIRAGVARLRSLPVRIGLQLMPGLPGGDGAEALASLRQALQLRPDFVRIYPTVVLPGTPLEEMLLRGRYRAWSLDEAVETCADMLLACLRAGIPVIRIGLPPLVVPAVAGPRHPALGQLVISRLWRRALAAALEQKNGTIQVSPVSLSNVLGHRRSNLRFLQERFGPLVVRASRTLDRHAFQVGSELFSWPEMAAAGSHSEAHYAA